MKKTALLLSAALLVWASCKQGPKTTETPPADSPVVAPPAAQDSAATKGDTGDTVTQKEYKAQISTSMGNIVIKLYNETPQHRDNFIKLVKAGFYKDLLFHRVIKGFMIQGGDPDSKNAKPNQPLGMGDPGYTIPAEFDPSFIHKKGALAAARTGGPDNPQKRSSGSQFYIVQGEKFDANTLQNMARNKGLYYTPEQITAYTSVGGTPQLDGDYTVFGEVVSGLDVVDKIAAQPGDPQSNRPFSDIRFTIKMMD